MSKGTDTAVDASHPDDSIQLRGTDHITVEGSNPEDTIEFYRDILGFPLVLSQPNLDREELTHLYFDTGDGRLLTFFVNSERDSSDLPDPDPGQVHHLAFSMDADDIDDIITELRAAKYPVNEYDRGIFHSIYTEDNNGLTIEIVADKFPIPEERRGEALATAHQYRLEDGAEFVHTEHMQQAIDELDLDVEQQEIRDAPAGRDF